MSSQPSGSNTNMDERKVVALKGYREVSTDYAQHRDRTNLQ